MQITKQVEVVIQALSEGRLVVYPTESVFGLGCDFRKEAAVMKLLNLKQRTINKGLILIASHVQQVLPLIRLKDQNHLARALKTWPGHHSWIFKASSLVPNWIIGDHGSVAIRISSHPAVMALCGLWGNPIVSTSANKAQQPAAKHLSEAYQQLGDEVSCYWDQPLGNQKKPSSIRLASDGAILR